MSSFYRDASKRLLAPKLLLRGDDARVSEGRLRYRAVLFLVMTAVVGYHEAASLGRNSTRYRQVASDLQ